MVLVGHLVLVAAEAAARPDAVRPQPRQRLRGPVHGCDTQGSLQGCTPCTSGFSHMPKQSTIDRTQQAHTSSRHQANDKQMPIMTERSHAPGPEHRRARRWASGTRARCACGARGQPCFRHVSGRKVTHLIGYNWPSSCIPQNMQPVLQPVLAASQSMSSDCGQDHCSGLQPLSRCLRGCLQHASNPGFCTQTRTHRW